MSVAGWGVDDRTRWNERYDDGDLDRGPSSFVTESLASGLVPASGRVLDVAGGSGADAVALAEHGLDVTVVDVSDVALALACRRADEHGIALTTIRRDLTTEDLPAGPWDVIVCVNYLERAVFAGFAPVLAPRGLVFASIATVTNLERHDRPSRRFLVDRGELRRMAEQSGLTVVRYAEDWFDDRHSARLIAGRQVPA